MPHKYFVATTDIPGKYALVSYHGNDTGMVVDTGSLSTMKRLKSLFEQTKRKSQESGKTLP